MPTGKIALRTTEEFMNDYTPTYSPIYALFLGGKSQAYERETGNLVFRRMQTVGDVRAHHITPKDTEIRQIAVMEGKKTYAKYFLATQFILSNFQDQQGVEEVEAQVLDEHHVQADELLMMGDGTTPGNVVNNGLYLSADPNYVLETPIQIPTASRLFALHNAIVATSLKANQVAGRKVLFIYGKDLIGITSSLYETAVRAFKTALQEALGASYSIVYLPDASTPEGAMGWIIANMDQTKLHYTVLPEVLNQGENEENMYIWFNFLMGSMMLEVLTKGGVIRQPATLQS